MKIKICLFLCFLFIFSCAKKNNDIPVVPVEEIMNSNIEITDEKRISSDTENTNNIFDINDFAKYGTGNSYVLYYRSTNKECIIFNKIFNGYLYIHLPDNELSKYIDKINNYMTFIGYNCKNELINAFNESENTKWRRIFDDEWYSNIVVSNSDITITNDGQINSRFFIQTYDENDRFAGRFLVDINENKIIYPHPEYGRD